MRRIVLAALTAAAVAVLAAVPGTSGAWTASLRNTSNAAGVSQWYTCTAASTALAGSGVFAWSLSEAASATTAADSSSANVPGTYKGTHAVAATGSTGGCARDAAQTVSLDGSTSFIGSAAATLPSTFPTAFSIAGWVRTTAGWSGGGDIVMLCSSNATSTTCGSRDYRLYLTGTGNVVLGVANSAGVVSTVRTAGSVTDGAWHHVAGTLSSAGMRIYVDGTDVTSTATAMAGASTTSAASITSSRSVTSGYWRVGVGDGQTNWPGHNPFGTGDVMVYLRGQLAAVAVYKTVLSDDQVGSLAAAGR